MAKSKWEDIKDKLTLVEGWARDGLTDEQIANNLGISKQTFYTYKKKHLDFFDSLKKGKEIVDYEVENALLKRALGYSYIETTKEVKYNKEKDKYEMITTKEVTKNVVPDTTAQIYWLKNRRAGKWKDKRDEDSDDNQISKVEQLLQTIKEDANK